jgi:hypothetical protein
MFEYSEPCQCSCQAYQLKEPLSSKHPVAELQLFLGGDQETRQGSPKRGRPRRDEGTRPHGRP